MSQLRKTLEYDPAAQAERNKHGHREREPEVSQQGPSGKKANLEGAPTSEPKNHPQPASGLGDRLISWTALSAVAVAFGSLIYVAITGPLIAKFLAAGALVIIVGTLVGSLFYAMNHVP